MRRRLVLALVGLVVLPALSALSALSGGRVARAEPPGLTGILQGDPAAGAGLFVAKGCARCHAVHGDGGTTGPDLGRINPKPPLLEMAGAMWSHAPIPDRPALESGDMASLLAFLYSLDPVDRPGDPAAGARLFESKGCRACHKLGGSGGDVGPELDTYGRYASPLFLGAALWKNGPRMARAMRERGVPRPDLRGNDIADLMAVIRASSPGPARVYARPGSAARGEDLFREKRCAECHALGGEGGKVGPDLGARGRLQGSLAQIAGAMWTHGPAMWAKMAERGVAVPALSPAELSDLVSLLFFLQYVDAPGDPARGVMVWRARGCGGCHGVEGGGQGAARPLADGGALGTPLALITAMWNHPGRADASLARQSWPTLKGTDVADLVAHVRATPGRPPDKGGKRP